jgi:hypothetical protein
MNKKIIVSVMLVGLLVFVAVMAFSQNNSTSTVRWEYTVLNVKYTLFEEEANKLGAQGWELVSVSGVGSTTTPWYHFKRRLP